MRRSSPTLARSARIAREAPGLDIHVSTQASTTNSESARVYKALGAKRVVLAREMTFDQIEAMSAAVGDEIELESFIHGAACMSYSGRCMLSSFLTGRSANRGACSQPCRWTYTLHERTRPDEAMPIEEDERGTAILSSRDICMMDHLPRLMESGVCCFKVEGRMKTEIYIGDGCRGVSPGDGRVCKRSGRLQGERGAAKAAARRAGQDQPSGIRHGLLFRPAEGLRRGGSA